MRPKGHEATIRLGDLEVFQLLYEPPETFVDLQIDLLLGESSYHQEASAAAHSHGVVWPRRHTRRPGL